MEQMKSLEDFYKKYGCEGVRRFNNPLYFYGLLLYA